MAAFNPHTPEFEKQLQRVDNEFLDLQVSYNSSLLNFVISYSTIFDVFEFFFFTKMRLLSFKKCGVFCSVTSFQMN